MSWFHQIQHYELGNFIMATPMLKALSEVRGEPIPVYFDSKHVRSAYVNCPFLDVLKRKPKSKAFATSERPLKRGGNETNYECYFRLYAKAKGYKGEMPHPYIDNDNTFKLEKEAGKKHVALMHGCLATQASKVKKKKLSVPVLNHMIVGLQKYGLKPVVIGSAKDKARFWSKTILEREPDILDYSGELSLVDSISVLSQCNAFISNDTGLYHVAGALNVPGLVFWIKTNKIANMSPAKNIVHMQDRTGNVTKFKTAINMYGKHLK